MQKIPKKIILPYKKIQKKTDSIFLSRQDYKFLIPKSYLDQILSYLQKDFFLNIYKGITQFSYENLYYDTADYRFFNMHRQGKFNRIKIRVRKYKNGEVGSYLECKKKERGEYTKKERIKIPASLDKKSILKHDFIVKNLKDYSLRPSDLVKETKIEYSRMSFINKSGDTRISLDYDVFATGSNGISCEILKNCLILEIKSNNYPSSLLRDLRRQFHMRKTNFSKYCISLCNIEPSLKKNKWKQVLKYINNINEKL